MRHNDVDLPGFENLAGLMHVSSSLIFHGGHRQTTKAPFHQVKGGFCLRWLFQELLDGNRLLMLFIGSFTLFHPQTHRQTEVDIYHDIQFLRRRESQNFK